MLQLKLQVGWTWDGYYGPDLVTGMKRTKTGRHMEGLMGPMGPTGTSMLHACADHKDGGVCVEAGEGDWR
jgi:hypothetical protein